MEGKDQNGQLLPDGNGFYKTTTTLKHYAMNNSEVETDPNGRLNGSRTRTTGRSASTTRSRSAKIVQASQNGAVMSSYNSVNGVPSAAEPVPDRHADARRRSASRATSRATATRSTQDQHRGITGSRPASRTSRRSIEQFAFTLGAGEDAECNAGYNGSEQLPRPDRAEHDRRAGR